MKDSYSNYLQHPSQQMLYNFLAISMGLLALNTEVWDWYNPPTNRYFKKIYRIQQIIVIVFAPPASFSQTLYLMLHYQVHEFAALAVMFAIMPVAYVILLKSRISQTEEYKTALRNFMSKMHIHNFLDKNMEEHRYKYIKEELIRVERSTRWTFVLLGIVFLICFISWSTVPIIHNIQNNPSIHNITVRLEVFVHLWVPFNYEFDFYKFMIMQSIGIYCGGTGVMLMFLFDIINLCCIFHLVAHIKILKYDLKTGFPNTQSDEEVRRNLVDLSNYYRFILTCFKENEAAFGLSIFGVYALNLCQGGLLLYQIMSAVDTETILTFGLMIPMFMGVLIMFSVVLENVRIEADDIPALVYDLSWESMSIPNQKLLLSILFQVQAILEFKAAFNTKTGIQPAMGIIKTVFSYYVMIRQSREHDYIK